MNTRVSIATKPLVYSTFRYIANKVYNALAEYIDNSIESYKTHIDILKPINEDNKLSVWIYIDTENDIIVIKDNAFGIEEKNYERAFELANIPLDASGLNEFGMGMKVSSIWLSNYWTVESSAYGEEVKKTFAFDLNDVVSNNRTDLDIKIEKANADEHYTIITLTKLSQFKPTARQIPYIKKHLTSIYSHFLRENMLNLYVNDEQLVYEELIPMKEAYYKAPSSKKILWKREFEFSAPKYVGNQQKGEYKVKGFIGILNKMSTGTENGFLLFRRGRVIGTSYDSKYRPKVLCGDEGSPRWKRIYGEMDVEGFDVSFTKNAFNEDDQFETFIEDLKDYISQKWKDFDIFGQAQNYVKPVAKSEITKTIASSIVTELRKTVEVVTVEETPDTNDSSKNTESPNPKAKQIQKDLFGNDVKDDDMIVKPVTGKVKIDGNEFTISIGCTRGTGDKSFYTLSHRSDCDVYESSINLDNDFFEKFGKSFKGDYTPIINFIKVMVAAELMLIKNGQTSGAKAFRSMFNKLFGII